MATLKELIDLHCDGVEGYSEIAAILNAPTVVPNPRAGEVDTYTVIAPITMDAIIEVVPTGEAAAIYTKAPNLIVNMQEAINANNMNWLEYLLGVAVDEKVGAISQETALKLLALLEKIETIEVIQPDVLPGPSIAEVNGVKYVTPEKIQEVMSL